LFAAFALVMILGGALGARWIQAHWLGGSHLTSSEIQRAIVLIGICLAARWLATFYQIALQGLERQRESGGVALFGALARTALSLIVIVAVRRDATGFFVGQLIGVFLEVVCSRVLLMRAQPRGAVDLTLGARTLRLESGFAASVAATAALATLINETDKLVLSHSLTLAELGFCSLVWTLCSGIRLATPPLAQVAQPRLVRLLAEGDRPAFVDLYQTLKAAFLVCVCSLAGTLAVLSRAALFAWTGDAALASHMAPVLAVYAGATGVSALFMPPYLLQFASGRTNLQLFGNIGFGAVLVPALFVCAARWHAFGVGAALLAGNLAFLAIWVPIVERRFLTSTEGSVGPSRWAIPVAAMGAAIVIFSLAESLAPSRLGCAGLVAVTAAAALVIGGVASKPLRRSLFARARLGLAALGARSV
jgi:O-antigen/teichoic acid export membrane protein